MTLLPPSPTYGELFAGYGGLGLPSDRKASAWRARRGPDLSKKHLFGILARQY